MTKHELFLLKRIKPYFEEEKEREDKLWIE